MLRQNVSINSVLPAPELGSAVPLACYSMLFSHGIMLVYSPVLNEPKDAIMVASQAHVQDHKGANDHHTCPGCLLDSLSGKWFANTSQ